VSRPPEDRTAMASTGIGERLRNARTARGLTLDDIEAATRIKQHYLDALEREAWNELPGSTYARGFLTSYARQLGIAPDEILGLYPSAQTPFAAVPRPVEVRITPAKPQSRLRRIVTAIVFVFVIGAVVLAYVLVGQLRQFAATRPRPGANAPAAGTAGGSGPQAARPGGTAGTPATVTSTSAPGATAVTPAGSTTSVTPAGQDVVIDAQATDRSWIRVVADGSVVFEGFLSAGDHQVWQGKHQVSIRVGNASALALTVNGQALGRLGNPGDVVDRTFWAAGPAGAPATAPPVSAPAPATLPAPRPSAPPPSVPPPPNPAPSPAGPSAPGPPAPASPAAPQVVTPTNPVHNDHN
jgi:cytoskeleton protein RodZ